MANLAILLATLVLCQTIVVFARPQSDFDNVNPGVQEQAQNPRPSQAGTTTTDAPEEYTNCVTNCQTTSQYDPICGTDMVSYNSRARLNCAQRCGLNVRVLHIGTCRSTAGGK